MPSLDFDNYHRANNCIAQGALTNSKHPSSLVFGCYPTHIESALGCALYSKDEQYIDYICGLGTNLLGYGNPFIAEKILPLVSYSPCHSLPTIYELETAEALKGFFPFCDRFKFLKSGSEACNASLRIARSFTGREKVLSKGYHGIGDQFISLTKPASGVPRQYGIDTLNECLDAHDFKEYAAVIIEPVDTDWSAERQKWLYELREKTQKAGCLLIFDEVITGFRFLNYSVANHVAIQPDLIVLGKAMAAGYPLAAVGGKSKIMDGDYFVSSTYAGDILSLKACHTVCQLLGSKKYDINELWRDGERFIEQFNETAKGFIQIKGYATRGVFEGDPLNKALFLQEAALAKILFCNSWFYNFPLMKQTYETMDFLKDFISRMKTKSIKLVGEMPRSPFAAKVRGQ